MLAVKKWKARIEAWRKERKEKKIFAPDEYREHEISRIPTRDQIYAKYPFTGPKLF